MTPEMSPSNIIYGHRTSSIERFVHETWHWGQRDDRHAEGPCRPAVLRLLSGRWRDGGHRRPDGGATARAADARRAQRARHAPRRPASRSQVRHRLHRGMAALSARRESGARHWRHAAWTRSDRPRARRKAHDRATQQQDPALATAGGLRSAAPHAGVHRSLRSSCARSCSARIAPTSASIRSTRGAGRVRPPIGGPDRPEPLPPSVDAAGLAAALRLACG